MEAKVYNKEGKESGKVVLPESIFSLPWNGDLVHQVQVSMQANKRAGIAHTKDRSEVSGTGKKPWRQKGTGRSRHGSRRSPIWRTGGVAHGPRNEKNYSKKINKKMRAKALYTVLAEKFRNGQVIFVDDISTKEMKTKEANITVQSLGNVEGFDRLKGSKKKVAFVALPERNETTQMSFNNLPHVETGDIQSMNILDLLNRKYLVVSNPAESLSVLESRLAKK